VTAVVLCALIASTYTIHSERVCVDAVQAAVDVGADPYVAAALVYAESRFADDRVSSSGRVGPYQITVQYYCPDGVIDDCDLYHHGALALLRYLTDPEWTTLREQLCHYNSGSNRDCTTRSYAFADRIIAMIEELQDDN